MTRPEALLFVPRSSSSHQSSRSTSPASRRLKLSKTRECHESTPSFSSTSRSISQMPSPVLQSAAVWADGPYQLIMRPRRRSTNVPSRETGASLCATEMSIIHNVVIRGLNSIVRQAPYIADASRSDYKPQNVKDLLFYIRAWCKNLEHHQRIEETTFFPLVEEMTGVVGLMDDLEVEHEEFHPGIVALKNYAERMSANPSEYRLATLKAMVSGFAPALINHLHAEIDFLMNMDQFDDEGLKRCWMESGKVAEKIDDRSDFFDLFPFIIGNADKTHDGGNDFLPVPKPLRFAMQHYFSKRHRGAWRFNCCDYFRQPVALQMIPESSEE